MNILSIVDQTMTTQSGNSTSQIKPHRQIERHACYLIRN
jgi:hypothetical protein